MCALDQPATCVGEGRMGRGRKVILPDFHVAGTYPRVGVTGCEFTSPSAGSVSVCLAKCGHSALLRGTTF